MKTRYLLGFGAALAVALGAAEANAQLLPFFGNMGPPTYYIGPEGGWTESVKPKGYGYYALFSCEWGGTV